MCLKGKVYNQNFETVYWFIKKVRSNMAKTRRISLIVGLSAYLAISGCNWPENLRYESEISQNKAKDIAYRLSRSEAEFQMARLSGCYSGEDAWISRDRGKLFIDVYDKCGKLEFSAKGPSIGVEVEPWDIGKHLRKGDSFSFYHVHPAGYMFFNNAYSMLPSPHDYAVHMKIKDWAKQNKFQALPSVEVSNEAICSYDVDSCYSPEALERLVDGIYEEMLCSGKEKYIAVEDMRKELRKIGVKLDIRMTDYNKICDIKY
jgi:hypothetical protein